MSVIVTLNWKEIYLCSTVAAMRMIGNMREGRQHRFGARGGVAGFQLHMLGCLGELAVSKAFNLFWAGTLGDFDAVDVGGIVQVRCAQEENYRLLLHPDDDDEQPYVLALAHGLPQIVLRGWIFGRVGKHVGFWEDPTGHRPAFFVPQTSLNPMEELRSVIERRRQPMKEAAE